MKERKNSRDFPLPHRLHSSAGGEDLRSILPYLPLRLKSSSSLVWPNTVAEALKAFTRGLSHTRVDSGEVLYLPISDIRDSSFYESVSPLRRRRICSLLRRAFVDGGSEEMIRGGDSCNGGGAVVAFAALLESVSITLMRNPFSLRLLRPQRPGIVFLIEELIGAIFSCSFLCMFSTDKRHSAHFPAINFDVLS